jgi:hypothetical protein
VSGSTLQVHVDGIAFWFARLPDWETARAVIRGERTPPDATVARPSPTLLAPTERRRAPDTVAVALEVASRAAAASGHDPASLPSVFASTHGDTAISDYMCSTLASTPTLISPIKFHNSVHNAAAGYWSIGARSFASYTAVSAYRHTFGAGLLEAATQAVTEGQPVLYVAFDIEARGPIATMAFSRGVLGAAVVLSPNGSERSQAQLTMELCDAASESVTSAHSPAADFVAGNAMAPCLPFFEALARDDVPCVRLGLSAATVLRVQVGR